jgi:hypothetical protein
MDENNKTKKREDTHSEENQSIYRMHPSAIETEFGPRIMTEIGTIKGLEIDDTVNYLLIPTRQDGEKTTAWMIHKLTKDCEVDVVSWDNLDAKEKPKREN